MENGHAQQTNGQNTVSMIHQGHAAARAPRSQLQRGIAAIQQRPPMVGRSPRLCEWDRYILSAPITGRSVLLVATRGHCPRCVARWSEE
jgi:hypothetical protein